MCNLLCSHASQRKNSLLNYFIVPMMEMFHPFKHLCEVVWGKDIYLFTLFGPLVHSSKKPEKL